MQSRVDAQYKPQCFNIHQTESFCLISEPSRFHKVLIQTFKRCWWQRQEEHRGLDQRVLNTIEWGMRDTPIFHFNWNEEANTIQLNQVPDLLTTCTCLTVY